jgi:mitogen-activated protein kinase kinase kinase
VTHHANEHFRSWDEKRVVEWLKTINCGQYSDAFRCEQFKSDYSYGTLTLVANHVNGSNLVECDQMVLKEMGIKKIGDRVRISVGIKNLRSKSLPNQGKHNRDSIAILDSRAALTPSSAVSPRSNHHREHSYNAPVGRPRPLDRSAVADGRPSSPLVDQVSRTRNGHAYGTSSPMDSGKREQGGAFFPPSSLSKHGKRPEGMTPGSTSSLRRNPSLDVSRNASTDVTASVPLVRVIHGGGETKVVDIKGCKTGDQIIQVTLRKLGLPEAHINSYCFYTVDDFCAQGETCRRVTDLELSRICSDLTRPERGRLILRKIHHGEPTREEIEKANSIHRDETLNRAVMENTSRSEKLTKVFGESVDTMQTYQLSPTNYESPSRKPVGSGDRSGGHDLTLPHRGEERPRLKPLKQFQGQRPESELISQELSTYFPDHGADEIKRTVDSAERRSRRVSRVLNRLSMASNSSMVSNALKDAPPIPAISNEWLQNAGASSKVSRPLSVSRFPPSWRESIVSASQLQTLAEESSEPNRKSYVSFDSGSDVAASGDRTSSFLEEGTTTSAEVTTALAEDGEGPDPELESFLSGNSWDTLKWMKGSLIGQGSFGSVFLALHAVTGELMAVKQVEMPSKTHSEMDKKKEAMVAALQREINLLERLQHPNIVKYLGSNYHDEHFNIFLEYVPGGSVAAMLNNYGQLQEPLIRNFVRQILEGLAYLHAQDIIHRDIKGANVLVDNKGQVKISDFGISKRVEVSAFSNPVKGGHLNRPSLQGSVFWMAPEVVKQTSYTLKADIWSLGCLVVEMFTGEHPFPDKNQVQALFQIGASAKPATPADCSDDAKAFLRQTFEVDHEKRPAAQELMNSTFLKQ